MKWAALTTVLVAMILGTGSFLAGRYYLSHEAEAEEFSEAAERQEGTTAQRLAWMKTRLNLSPEEFGRVCQLHTEYMADCRHMADELDVVRDRMKATLRERSEFDEVALAALKEYEAKYDQCERAATAYLLKSAAVMDRESRQIYLEMMLPRVFPDHHQVMQAKNAKEGRH